MAAGQGEAASGDVPRTFGDTRGFVPQAEPGEGVASKEPARARDRWRVGMEVHAGAESSPWRGAAPARYAFDGVSMKAIAEALGRGLKVPVVSIKPEEAGGTLRLACPLRRPLICRPPGALTQQKLNWRPTGPGLIADLDGTRTTPRA